MGRVESDSLKRLIRDLRKFEDKKVVLAHLRKELRRPLPAVRKAIRGRALATLPSTGGFAAWVAMLRITARIRTAGRSAGVTLVGGRNSTGARSDVDAIDRGRLRAPSWGRTGRGDWHTQEVTPQFFTGPAGEIDQWQRVALDAIEQAADTLARGR